MPGANPPIMRRPCRNIPYTRCSARRSSRCTTWHVWAPAAIAARKNARRRRTWCFRTAVFTCATWATRTPVAEANQVLFFKCRRSVSHQPSADRRRCQRLAGDQRALAARTDAEGAGARRRRAAVPHAAPAHRSARAGTVALLRHSLRHDVAETLEARHCPLTLARRALGPRTPHESRASHGRRRLVDRMKLTLASDLRGAGPWPTSPPR